MHKQSFQRCGHTASLTSKSNGRNPEGHVAGLKDTAGKARAGKPKGKRTCAEKRETEMRAEKENCAKAIFVERKEDLPLRKSRGNIEAWFVQNAKTMTESIKIH